MALTIKSFLSASLAAGGLFLVGDVASQAIKMRAQSATKKQSGETWSKFLSGAIDAWDYERTLKMTAFGFGFNGPYSLAGFHLLDRILGPSSTFKQAAIKAIASQTFLSPPYLGAFLLFSAIYVTPEDGHPIDTAIKKFPELYYNAWTVWPAVNMLAFRFLHKGVARVAFLNAVGVGWNTYMTSLGAEVVGSSVAIEAMAINLNTPARIPEEDGDNGIDELESRPLLGTSTFVVPFIYFMVRDFGLSNEKDVGFYVGFIASAFSLAQFMTSLLWGWVSDRVGRRPSLQMAIASRFLCGILNGNIGIAKCVIGEITDSTNQSFGFSLIGIMWSCGTIIGPILGGCLANPVVQFPWLFEDNEFLTRNPYFLPCGVSAGVSLVGFVIGYFYMEETNEKLVKREGEGLCEEGCEVAQERVSGDGNEFKDTWKGKRIQQANVRDSVDTMVEEDRVGSSSRCGSLTCLEIEDSESRGIQGVCQRNLSANEITATAVIDEPPPRFGKAAKMSILAYTLLAFQNIILEEVFSLWIVTGPDDGGLGYSSAEVGIVLSIIGALALYMVCFLEHLRMIVINSSTQ
ncbi:UNVERIFIED_CONTAM: hypothetical protein HDU68_011688 [Siphonaria sp. JEL0065]|nr:hypothetical protein HDU68_011688 [Siphonaria sp. JEL0065]